MALRQYGGSGGLTPSRSYTIGAPGVTGVDYNFTSVGNANEQSIQLGAANIVPANSPVTEIVVKCTATLVGGTATTDIGLTSGSDEYISSYPLSISGDITSASAQIVPSSNTTSIYFSITPSANWNTLSGGTWKISIYYNMF